MADKPSIKYFISQRLHSPRMERVGRGCWKKEKYIEKMNKKKEAPARHNDVDSGSSGKKCHSTQTLAFFWPFSFRQLRHKFLGKKRAW